MQMHLESSILLLLLPGCGCGGAVTVAGDCCYGPCKSSVPVMKISKRIKEREKKKRTWDSRRICVSSPPFTSEFPTIVVLARNVLVDVAVLGVRLNMVEGRKNEGSRADDELNENQPPTEWNSVTGNSTENSYRYVDVGYVIHQVSH